MSWLSQWVRRRFFAGSVRYWERRYAKGGNSGSGSTGALAEFKAKTLNEFVSERQVSSVVEFGCGDGQQLALYSFPRYTGLDVSREALARCIERFAGRRDMGFLLYDTRCFEDAHDLIRADMAISIDVIYHLVEDEIYVKYMRHLFGAAERFVVIYSTNCESRAHGHVRNREFLGDVERMAGWRLSHIARNPFAPGSGAAPRAADFYFFERTD
jgi:SAM-dependent methyltransferase